MAPISLTCTIITLSDRASQGIYQDKSGLEIENCLINFFATKEFHINIQKVLLPDDAKMLKETFQKSIIKNKNFIFTTGGTGIGPHDITVDVIKPLLSKEIPGIMEIIRVKYGSLFPAASISRSIAGVAGNTLVYCLPGSPKAVKEYMEEILKTLIHLYYMLHSIDNHTT